MAGEAGAAFIAAAQQLGFRIMPHFNYFAIDPNHPLFSRVRDFAMRDVRTRKLMGWRWKSGVLPFPQGHGRIADFRSTKAMAYLHTGLSLWRRELVRRIGAAAAELRTPALFVDQTLCTFDLDNALVENLTCWDGMVALTRELTELDGPPAVGGEGLNELSMRYQTFAQAHLFKSWHANCANFEQLDPVPVGDFLYGDLCRTMGYANLSGRDEASALRLLVHEKLNALPSLTVREAEEIENPCPAVRRVLDRATG